MSIQRGQGRQKLKLGLMDFGFVLEGTNAPKVLNETLRLASLADSLGFSRYWLPEHHESHYAWAGPEMLLPLVGNVTSRIKLGAAAILLNLYRPLKIAENFRLLSNLYPGRVDLGVCAGIPLLGDLGESLVQRGAPEGGREWYGENVSELRKFIHGEHDGLGNGKGDASLWLMGSGKGNSILASMNGAALSYTIFHRGSGEDPDLLDLYYDRFIPCGRIDSPQVNIALSIICHEDERRVIKQKAMVEALVKGDIRINVAGTPSQCLEQICEIVDRYGVDELILNSLWKDYDDRAQVYEILAETFEIQSDQAPISAQLV